jgi:hypothetical protein
MSTLFRFKALGRVCKSSFRDRPQVSEKLPDSANVIGKLIARPRLRERVHEEIRRRNYSRRTEKSYWFWIRWFFRHHGLRHPEQMGAAKAESFLS